jgi:hypothetical protein
LSQAGAKTEQLISIAYCQNLNAAVGLVADPPGDAQHVRFAFDKPAETHALNTSADQETPSFCGFF